MIKLGNSRQNIFQAISYETIAQVSFQAVSGKFQCYYALDEIRLKLGLGIEVDRGYFILTDFFFFLDIYYSNNFS